MRPRTSGLLYSTSPLPYMHLVPLCFAYLVGEIVFCKINASAPILHKNLPCTCAATVSTRNRHPAHGPRARAPVAVTFALHELRRATRQPQVIRRQTKDALEHGTHRKIIYSSSQASPPFATLGWFFGFWGERCHRCQTCTAPVSASRWTVKV